MPRSTRRIGPALLLFVMATVVGPATAFASPPVPSSFGAAIEPLAAYDAQSTCSPTAKPGTVALRSLVQAAYPGTGDYGIVANCANGGVSEHYEGRAWDWKLSASDPVQDAQAKDFFNWLFAPDAQGNRYAMARRLGIMYMIYNQRIWGSYYADQGWRPYTGSSPHTDHVHISLTRAGGDKLTSYWTGVGSGGVLGTPPGAANGSTPALAPPPYTGDQSGPLMQHWTDLGGPNSPLGAPTSAAYGVRGGLAQDFQGGRVYWSAATGAQAVWGSIGVKYAELGGPDSPLGLPTSDERDVPGGRANTFQGGQVVWSLATGARAVYGSIGVRYAQLGGPGGPLGLPTSDEQAASTSARVSEFQKGRVYWSLPTGTHAVLGAIADEYARVGGPSSGLGLPVGDEADVAGLAGARLNPFQGGEIYWTTARGANAVYGSIGEVYRALGGPGGALGMPTSSETGVMGGRVSTFEQGAVYWSPEAGAHALLGSTLDAFQAGGGPGGALGLPIGDEVAVPGGRMTPFTGGGVYTLAKDPATSPTTPATPAIAVSGSIAARYAALGGPSGVLGMPLGAETAAGAGRQQRFAGGVVASSTATGTHAVYGSIGVKYAATGGATGALGLPTSDEADVSAGRQSSFQGGVIVWSVGTGAQAVQGSISVKYLQLGGASGPLGLPLTDETSVRNGRQSTFQGGRVIWSLGTGAQAVYGSIAARYSALGGPDSALGLPTSDETAAGSGRMSAFQGGRIYWSLATGARLVSGTVLMHYEATGGPTGVLGIPSGELQPLLSGLWQQAFTGGRVYVSEPVTLHVSGPALDAYLALGGPAGQLGRPLSDTYIVPEGQRTDFERGSLIWQATMGRVLRN